MNAPNKLNIPGRSPSIKKTQTGFITGSIIGRRTASKAVSPVLALAYKAYVNAESPPANNRKSALLLSGIPVKIMMGKPIRAERILPKYIDMTGSLFFCNRRKMEIPAKVTPFNTAIRFPIVVPPPAWSRKNNIMPQKTKAMQIRSERPICSFRNIQDSRAT